MINFFQMLLKSFTTENVNLITIMSVPLIFIENYIAVLLFTSLLNISINKKQKTIYILLMSTLGIITNLFIPKPYGTFINIIAYFFSNLFILKANLLKSLLAFLIPFIITIVLELLLANIYNLIFNADYAATTNIPLNRFVFSVIIYLTEYTIYIIIKKFKVNFFKVNIMDRKKKILFTLSNILATTLIASQLYILTFYSANMPLFITMLNIIGLITYFVINLYSMLTVSKLETTSTNLEEAQLYNKTLEILQDNTRAFRHDFANILQGMVGYMDNNDMEGLKKYYSQLVEDIQHSNNIATLSPSVVNNPAIYNVLASKYHKADSLGIKINLEAFLNMNELHIKIYEFTRVLGILMDNAIEATSECDEKIINVIFRKSDNKRMQLLIVENTYMHKDIDTEKIFEKGYSTKENNTGLGLWEIRQILKRNNNLNLFTTKDKNFFRQQFEIYY